MTLDVDALAQNIETNLCNPYGSRVLSKRDLDSLVTRVRELEAALWEAREEVRQSKFRYESFGDATTPGEINTWIFSRDVALARIDRALTDH